MLFNKERYYNSITTLESISIIKTLLIIAIITLGNILINNFTIKLDIILPTLTGIIIGLLVGYISYCYDSIKTEEMKMKFDIYNKIMEQKD